MSRARHQRQQPPAYPNNLSPAQTIRIAELLLERYGAQEDVSDEQLTALAREAMLEELGVFDRRRSTG
jgi:RNase H-fold protein (predicted Holliday junction resolvase)